MSQDYELVTPKKKRAYPILVEEWEHLKTKISSIKDNANFYHTAGSILLGVAGSALIAAITLDMPEVVEGQTPMPIIIAWFSFITFGICGSLALLFGSKQREIQQTSTNEVIQQMTLIEKRYESDQTS